MKNKKYLLIGLTFLVCIIFFKIGINSYLYFLESKNRFNISSIMTVDELKFEKKKVNKKLFFNPFLIDPIRRLVNINFTLLLKGESKHLEDVLKQIKLSVLLNRNDIRTSVNAIKKILFLWDKISDKDKSYYSSLFLSILSVLKKKDINTIIDIWQKNCKDISFFEKALFLKPIFFKKIADSFILLEKYMKERWVFLSNHEIYYLSVKHDEFYNLKFLSKETIKLKEAFLQQLSDNIKGYYVLANNKNFKEAFFNKLLSDVYLSIIDDYLKITDKNKTVIINIELLEYMEIFLNNKNMAKNINKLEGILKKNSFFNSKTKQKTYINNLINFKKGNFVKVINNIEEILKKNINLDAVLFNKYIFMLLDSCIANNLYLKAEELIQKYENKCTNKLRLFQIKLKINDILHNKSELNDQEKLLLKRMNSSCHFEFNWKNISRKIYLQKQGIIFVKVLKQKNLKGNKKGLIQILVNNKVKKEVYINDVNETIIYKMPDNEFLLWDSWDIEIKFLDK